MTRISAIVLHLIAGALATTRPASAAIIRGAAEANVPTPPTLNKPIALAGVVAV